MASANLSLGLKAVALAALLPFAAAPADAGLNKGSVTIESAIVYLGVVPASQTRDYVSEHAGDMTMGGAVANDVNTIHLVVALFDRTSGRRITNAHVSARFLGERGRKWSLALKPMTMNGAMTYGAYSNLGGNNKASIFIDVDRPFGLRTQSFTARFEYSQD